MGVRRKQYLLGLAMALCCAGCMVGPKYQQPDVPTPEKFRPVPIDQNEAPLSQPMEAQAELSEWWKQFGDEELQHLIARARESNLDLKSAASRIRQARAQEIIAGARRLPTVNATGMAAHVHSNSNPLGSLGGGSSGAADSGASSSGDQATNITLYSAGFDATWELDLFGGALRTLQAARAQGEASFWQWRDAQVSLSAEVANEYLLLRTTQARVAIVSSTIEQQQGILRIVDARWRAGFVSELDVNQQRTQLASVTAELPELQAQENAQKHALAMLLALEPNALADELSADKLEAGEIKLPAVPTTLPIGLPSELLRRRPDIRAAERELAAATAREGAAVADLYPKFNLIGSASFSSDSLGDLLDSRHFSTAAIGLIRWPIFQAGKVRANIRVTEEQRTQSYLTYQKAVLKALQDTADALDRFTAEQRRLLSLREARTASASSLRLAEQQYRAGLVNFQSVLTASTAALNVQEQLAQSNQMLAQNLVSLYKALGGGWSPDESVAAVSGEQVTGNR
jgi:multidrug efflux system outer membrane protein